MGLKLLACGISGNLYSLITGYLTNRKQHVEIEGQRWNKVEITNRVPHGPILGLKLFSIYTNDLPEVPKGGKLEFFADDATFYCTGRAVDEVTSKLQSILYSDKTGVMLIKSKELICPLKPVKLNE